MKKLLFLLLMLPTSVLAKNGTVLVIDKLAPRNAAFVGVVDASQTVVNAGSFSKNLSVSDIDVQHALNTIDQLATGGTPAGLVVSTLTVTSSTTLNATSINASSLTVTNVYLDYSLAQVFMGANYVKRTVIADSIYTATSSDYLISYSSLSTGRTVTLPAPTTLKNNQVFIVKDESGTAGTNNITLSFSNIDGASTKVINSNYGSIRVYTDGFNYFTW